MLAYSVSRSELEKTDSVAISTSLLCVLILTRQNMGIQPSMTFQIWFFETACFPYGRLPSVGVDRHHDGCPSKLIPT